MLNQPSPLDTVFCPHCHTLLMDSDTCPNGDWQRPESGGLPGTSVWQKDLQGEIGKPYFSLATAGSLLIAGVEKGERRSEQFSELVALDTQSGSVRWTYALAPNRFARFITISKDILISSSEHLGVLAGAQCFVQALNVHTGRLAWETELPAHSHSAPAILGDLLLIIASDHHVYALNRADGSIAWRSSELPNWSPAPPTTGSESVFIGGFTHIITSITLDGQERVLISNESETDWFDIPFAYNKGILYAPSSSRQLHAIETTTGAVKWSQSTTRGASAPPIVNQDQIFLPVKARPSGRYILRALDQADGKTLWEFDTHKHILVPPFLNEGTLYFGSRGGVFYAVNAADGELSWQMELDEAVRSTTVINGSYLFFGTAKGLIHCLRWKSESQEPLLSAESYRSEGEWLMAGTAAAKAEQWLEAAADFERADHPFVAAQLYERCGDWASAAPLYEECNHFQQALHAYEQVGNRSKMAEMHLQLQQPEIAAKLYADLGDYGRAADIYHEGGYLRRAAANYTMAGDTEQAIKLYLALKQPESAAELAEESGDIDEAVAIWVNIDNFKHAAELLAASGRRAEAADLLEANGHVHAAAGIWSNIGEMEKAAQIYDNANLWSDAARCYEDAGLTLKAAQAYYMAGEARQAADLYKAAGKLQKALAIYAQLKAFRSIAMVHEQQGQYREAARAYLASNPPRYEKAARCFVKAQAWVQAAQAFEDAGLIDEAVASWRKSDTPRRAAQLLRDKGHLQQAANLFIEIGKLQDAAEIELELGQIKKAVIHYRELGNDERAVQVARAYQRWDIISELARESGDFEQEAEAALALARESPTEDYLHYRAAAKAYVRAAQKHEAREERLISDEAIARLWDLAARYFDQGMIENKQLITQSQRQARRLRHWPEIVVEVEAERKLVIDRWDGLIVNVKNIGYGMARHVSTKVIAGEFEGKLDTTLFSGILPGRTERIRLNVRPRSAGSSVPLDIRLSYMRVDHEIVERDISTEVPVHDIESQSMTSEGQMGQRRPIKLHRDDDYEDDQRRQTIIVHGNLVTVGSVSGGNMAIGDSSSAGAVSGTIQQVAENAAASDPPAALSTLSEKMDANLTLNDINTLARNLDVDFAGLPGTVKIEKAFALVAQLAENGRLEPLFALLNANHADPNVNWRAGFEEYQS